MMLADPAWLPFWRFLTRLGEAQILLPAAALSIVTLARQREGRALAGWWLALLAAAVAVTTASKVAFIGWGIGCSALNFTGVSGHAMFAAAVYPVLLGTLAPATSRTAPGLAMAAGAALALLVGASRIALQAHSWSEVTAGLMLGGAVAAMALTRGQLPQCRANLWVPVAIVAWLAMMPTHAPPSHSHALVTRLALAISGRQHPYTRDAWLRKVPASANTPRAHGMDAIATGA